MAGISSWKYSEFAQNISPSSSKSKLDPGEQNGSLL